MKKKIMYMKNKVKSKTLCLMNTSYITKAAMLLIILSQIGPAYAVNVFDAVDGASGTILNQLTETLNTSVFPFTFVILIIVTVFNLGNQKVIDVVEQGYKWWAICFFGLNGLNLIFNTMYWIKDLMGGSSQVGGGVTGSEVVE